MICYKPLTTGWMLDDTFRPSFSDLENTMRTFSITPDQYVFTVVCINYNVIALFNIALLIYLLCILADSIFDSSVHEVLITYHTSF